MARSTDWSRYSRAKGEPARACGHVWVERLKSEITSLTNVPGAIDERVAVAWGGSTTRMSARGRVVARGVASPRAPACVRVVVVLGLRADGGTSSSLGVVIAGVDRPLGLPWADPRRLNALEEPMCSRGWLLCLGHAVALGQESSRVLALESSWCDGVATTAFPLLGKAIASSVGPS
jgi:hypothetical protein